MEQAHQQVLHRAGFDLSQNIQDNAEQAASGVMDENSVKLFGNDRAALEKTAD